MVMKRPAGPLQMMPRFWILGPGSRKEQHFDVVELKETIEKGQRISGFTIDNAVNGHWAPLWGWLDYRYRRLIKVTTS